MSIPAPREEGDFLRRNTKPQKQYFYPRPPRGGRRHGSGQAGQHEHFYPRPPRGGRLLKRLESKGLLTISIHALREEGDLISCIRLEMTRIFLSTPSARRATFRNEVLEMSCEISIHALREEGDSQIRKISPSRRPFLSTPSARRATG